MTTLQPTAVRLPLIHALFPALRHARLDRHEIAGSLGDLGTFLPLLVGMASQNGLNFATALFFAGLFNLLTGLFFAIPLAVQPMKAIAAVALTQGLTTGQIVAAGATVSAVILVLGLTGLIGWLNRVIPASVVRGLQLALGLSLAIKGLQMAGASHVWLGPDGYVIAIVAGAGVLLLMQSKLVPPALLLFVAGLGLAVWKSPQVLGALEWGIALPAFSPPALRDFTSSFTVAALPQIPLTTLNSVIAVCALSTQLFPQHATPPRHVAVSVGMMNLLGVGFGAMPMCHGAGGLAGQYRFGARTNGSILFLGSAKLLAAVLLGTTLLALCQSFPLSILGVLLVVSGVELARAAMSSRDEASPWPMLATTCGCLAFNIAAGFGIGLAVALLPRLVQRQRPQEAAA
jgi:MFS superfamily sulfate permease-like transporter